MELDQAIAGRHAYRLFDGEPVDRAVLERMVESARSAPSSLNAQPWRFDVTTGESRAKVGAIMAMTTVYLDEYVGKLPPEKLESAQRFYSDLGNAPVVIVVSVEQADDELGTINNLISTGAAIENLLLTATAAGIQTCNITFSFWVRDEISAALGIPDTHVVTALVLAGHASEPALAPEHDRDVARFHE